MVCWNPISYEQKGRLRSEYTSRLQLWFTCAGVHDPVIPILTKPSVSG